MTDPTVSIGLPVRNGEHRIEQVVACVLAQDYPHIELVISDNASNDATEEMCREFARRDERIVYHRQAENVGITRNYQIAMQVATGAYFRWVSHDDSLAPTYVSKLLPPLLADDQLLLMTSAIEYELDDGSTVATSYSRDLLRSVDAVDRFGEVLRMYTEGFASVPDPLYGLMRRAPIASIPRRNMLREDEIFAAKLALAGRWGHDPEILASRGWSHDRSANMTKKLDVPRRRAFAAWAAQSAELLRVIADSHLDARQRRSARAAVARLFVRRHQRWAERGLRRVAGLVSAR